MYDLSSDIEVAHQQGTSLGGLTLDLTKAFNQFPRKFVEIILRKMGVPQTILHQWMCSLPNIRRHFDHRGWISEGHKSTTGVAEGDAASIIAMLGVASFWIGHLEQTGANIKVYADNLSWSAASFVTHEECLKFTVEVFSLMRIPIDWDKSWAWCTQKKS